MRKMAARGYKLKVLLIEKNRFYGRLVTSTIIHKKAKIFKKD